MTRTGIRAWAGLVCVVCAGSLAAQQGDPSAEVSSGAAASAATRVPHLVQFSGTARDLSGQALTGPVELHFAIYQEQADATALWQETQTLQVDEQGRYTVLLGATQPEGLPAELFVTGVARWLGIAAGRLPEQPRVLLVSVPYALKAADAETLGGKPASAYALNSSSGTATLAVALPASGTTAASLTSMTGTQPKAAVSAGATEFNDTTADQVVRVTQKGTGYGLYALVPSNTAVFGRVTNSSGTSYAVRGITPSPSGAGVFGESTSTTGGAYGVRGQSVSDAGGGVLGVNTSPTGVAYGVMGITDSAQGAALAARARATTGAALGVQAITYSSSGTAVFAQAAPASGPTTGVLARVNSGSGTALVADNARGGKILSARVGDVEKLSVSGNGNVTTTGNVTAASFSGSGAGLTGVAALTAASAANATNADTANSANNLGGVPAASYARRDTTNTFSGNQAVNGNLTVNGTVTGTQFYGDGSGLTVSGTALAAVLARLQTLENIVLPPRPTGAHIFSKAFGTAVAYGSTEIETGFGVAADKNGNILITGEMRGPVDFGGGPVSAPVGRAAAFVAKFSGVDGSHLWSKAFASEDWCDGNHVAVDPNGNVFVTGNFFGTVDFGGGPLTGPGQFQQGNFVVKLSGTSGSHLWSKVFNGNGAGPEVAVDTLGNVFVTGTFNLSTDLGGGPLLGRYSGMYLGKLSGADGSHLWSKAFAGVELSDFNGVEGYGIAVDASGNVIVVSRLFGSITVDFGGGPLTGPGLVVAKLSGADGSHLWSKAFAGGIVADCAAAAVDPAGNVLVTGSWVGELDLGGGLLTDDRNERLFVGKFSGVDGSYLWSKAPAASEVNTRGQGVAVDAGGNVLVAGTFYNGLYGGWVDFGGGPLSCAGGSQNIFVAKFSGLDGSHFWSKGFGSGTEGGWGQGVATDPSGNVLVTGEFYGTVDFGGGPLTSVPNPDGGPSPDIFLLKLHP
jgi:hypothetical protein